MRTNLAYIDSAAEAATHVAKETFRYAGFEVEREVESDQLRLYRDDVETLKKHLDSVGVKPLAILPRAWWSGIVKRSKLIETDSSGAIRLATQDWMDGAFMFASLFLMAAFFATSLAVATTVAYYVMGAFGHWDVGDAVLTGILASMLTTVVFQTNWARRILAAGIVSKVFGSVVLYDMWSNENGKGAKNYSYDFPVAPADVQDVLLKLSSKAFRNVYDAKVRVAAVPEAFSLRETTVARIIAGDHQANWEATKQRIVDEWNDPIVVVQLGRAVAVVAQFGDFPIEKEIVDKVVGRGLSYDE